MNKGVPKEAESDEDYKFMVDIKCEPNKLGVSWHLTSRETYVVSLNYACTSRNGSIVSY